MKSIKIALLSTLFVAVISSCSDKIEGFSDYKEAADNGRFDISHQFIDRMDSQDQYEPLRYVFNKEFDILTKDLNRESVNDIRELFSKYKKIGTYYTDKACETLINKAITKKNIALCEDLMSLHKDEDFSDEIYIAILNMYQENDIAKFRDFALSRIDNSDVNKYVIEYLMTNTDEELLKYFITKHHDNFFDNQDVIELFEKRAPQELKKMIRMEILKLKKSVPSMPAIGIVKSDTNKDIPNEYAAYNSAVQRFNAKCLEKLNYAYNLNDKELANFIVNNMCNSLTYQSIGSWGRIMEKTSYEGLYDAFKVTPNSDDIKTTREQINVFFN